MGFANGDLCPHIGHYIREFDHDADNGRGRGWFTQNIRYAKKFATAAEAHAFYRYVPKSKPLRDDGLPNRPMTAMHALIEPAP
jgi:hypothetical protein